jgi:predicted porin
MQTTRLCLAVAIAAVATTSASAEISLYGAADVYLQAIDGTSRLLRVQSGGSSASRLGLRGEEDLGGGMTILFLLESGLQLDTGTVAGGGAFWGRQALVGLGAPWGQVTFGRQHSTIYQAALDFNLFGLGPAGPAPTLIGGFAGGYEPIRGSSERAQPPASRAAGSGSPARLNNSVRFESRAQGGFILIVGAGLGERTGGTTDARALELGLRYGQGGAQSMLSVLSDRLVVGGVRLTDVTVSTLVASYDWGPWRIVGGVLHLEDRRPAAEDGRGYWLGGSWRNGPHLLRTQWVSNRPRARSESSSQVIGVGYGYDLSRRTQLYGTLSRFTNDRLAGDGFGRFNGAVPAGITRPGDTNLTELLLGVRHAF